MIREDGEEVMIIVKRQKIADTYSRYFYLYDTDKIGLDSNKILRTSILGDDVTHDPAEAFEVKLDDENAYIETSNGKLDVGYSTRDLKRFFYCIIV